MTSLVSTICAPAGQEQREGVQERAGAQGGHESVDLCQFDEQSVDDADENAAGQDDDDREGHRHAVLRLQYEHDDVPQPDGVADRDVDLAGRHRYCDRQSEDC